MLQDPETRTGGSRRTFPATVWSRILETRDVGGPAWEAELQELLECYWKPVYWSIRAGWRKSNEDAKDLTQAFLASLIERKFWENLDPSRGRFRSFLRAALENFMRQSARDATALKRGGGRVRVRLDAFESLDKADLSAQPGDDPFHREWVQRVIELAVQRVRGMIEDRDFELLRLRDLAPGEGEPPSYGALAEKLGLSLSDVRNRLHAARLALRREILAVISSYSRDAEEAERELKELFGGV